MINKTLSQKGSAHAVIIIILVVALLGALGFIFWQNFIAKGTPVSDTATQVESNQEDIAEKNKSAEESNQLVLNDWNLTFTISPSLTSTKVEYRATDIDTYVFTTARIQALGGECAKSPFGDTVSLTRFTEKPIAVPDGELLNGSPINSYYYVLSGPISSCSSLDGNQQTVDSVNPIEIADRNALKTTLKTLSAN